MNWSCDVLRHFNLGLVCCNSQCCSLVNSVKPSLDSFLGLMRWTITNIERLGEKSDSDLHEMADNFAIWWLCVVETLQDTTQCQ